MNNVEILEEAIQKAQDKGFVFPDYMETTSWSPINHEYPIIIFNHDFAKALWGEEDDDHVEEIIKGYQEYSSKDMSGLIPKWKRHLQQMVIADDPIKYLGDNI